jgi:hypothetical protein
MTPRTTALPSWLVLLGLAVGSRALTLWVPVEMRDRLQTELAGTRGRSGSVEFVEGLAAYTGFRQAGVSTQEEFHAPGSGAR